MQNVCKVDFPERRFGVGETYLTGAATGEYSKNTDNFRMSLFDLTIEANSPLLKQAWAHAWSLEQDISELRNFC